VGACLQEIFKSFDEGAFANYGNALFMQLKFTEEFHGTPALRNPFDFFLEAAGKYAEKASFQLSQGSPWKVLLEVFVAPEQQISRWHK